MKTALSTILILCNFWIQAQNNAAFFRAAYAIGEGNQVATNQGIQSLFGNPAGLTGLEGICLYAGAENRFELLDLTAFQIAAAIPVNKFGCMGFSLTDFGGSLYRDQRIGLAYARKLSEMISIGAQFDWMIMGISSYGNRHSFTFDIGLQSRLTDQLSLGFHLFSPYPVRFGEERIIPTYLSLGLLYRVSPQVELKAEVQKHSYENPSFHMGLRYAVFKALSISIGMRTEPENAIVTTGFSFRMKQYLRIDFGMNFHQSLGISSGIGFSFQIT